jgi:hypothetical protein
MQVKRTLLLTSQVVSNSQPSSAQLFGPPVSGQQLSANSNGQSELQRGIAVKAKKRPVIANVTFILRAVEVEVGLE